jgi:hypothetical protein
VFPSQCGKLNIEKWVSVKNHDIIRRRTDLTKILILGANGQIARVATRLFLDRRMYSGRCTCATPTDSRYRPAPGRFEWWRELYATRHKKASLFTTPRRSCRVKVSPIGWSGWPPHRVLRYAAVWGFTRRDERLPETTCLTGGLSNEQTQIR